MSRKIGNFVLDDGPVLVTGAGGFVGQKLMDMFKLGAGDIAADSGTEFSAPPGVRKIQWELPGPPPSSLGQVRYVIHLAGLSSVSNSRSSAEEVISVNAGGTQSVIQWISSRSPEALLLLASSAEIYKPDKSVLEETSSPGPRSPYGESKLKAEKCLRNSELNYVIARSFPHFGPGQSGHFVLPSFCRRIIRSVSAGEDVISTGNLTAVRDYLYIDDVIMAYACILAGGRTGETYNVCSGTGHSIGELLEIIIGISGALIETVIDPHLLREGDQFCQVGSPEKLKALGWGMNIPLEEGLMRLYQWWEERLL